jgi:chemotaxis protein MotB
MSKHKGGHHGGAWKVAYADFITAMMALFLVLWLTAQDAKIKEAVERAFRNPFSSPTKESVGILPNKDVTATYKASGNFQSISAVEIETMRRISEDLAKILQQQDPIEKTVQLDLTTEGLRINVFDRTHKPIFEPQSDALTSYGSWVFSTLAWEISRYSSFKLELEGHTEAGPEAAAQAGAKWDLSTQRANAARRMLVQNGVSAAQVCKVSGYADTVPMPDVPPTAESNRRVTVLLKLKETLANLSASVSQRHGDSSAATSK